jgi:hypothetical protein
MHALTSDDQINIWSYIFWCGLCGTSLVIWFWVTQLESIPNFMCSWTRAPHTVNTVLKFNRAKTCASFDALLRQEKGCGECKDGVWSWWLYRLVSLFVKLVWAQWLGWLEFLHQIRHIKWQQYFNQSTKTGAHLVVWYEPSKTKLWPMNTSTHPFNGLSPTTCANNKVKSGTLYSESKPHEEWKSCSLIIMWSHFLNWLQQVYFIRGRIS